MAFPRSLCMAVVSVFGFSGPALACSADIMVTFSESAPKDIFVIQNQSDGWSVGGLTFDLSPSRGNLIFDTDEGGPGLQVAQPFEQGASTADLATRPRVTDGDAQLQLRFDEFQSGQAFKFTIDVDDRLTAGDMGQTRVSGSEIQGAMISFELMSPDGLPRKAVGVFDSNSTARLDEASCA